MFERTNHMPRNMVIGKHKYLDCTEAGTYSPPSLNVVLMQPHAGARRLTTRRRTVAWILVVEVGDPDPQPGKIGKYCTCDSGSNHVTCG